MVVYYDSKDEYYKSPFGAVEAGTDIYFRAGVDRRFVLKEMCLVIYPDNGKEEKIRGSWADLVLGQDFYAFEWSARVAGLYFYHFEAVFPDGRKMKGKTCQLTVYEKHYNIPEWLGSGIMYQIFPDRFARSRDYDIPPIDRKFSVHEIWGEMPVYKPDANGAILNNDFSGGNLRGIIDKLPYLSDLGVTVLYLNPIVEAFSNHRYDTANYKNVDPVLGTVDDFRNLCEESRKHGIRIILDGVFNHTGSDSLYFNKYGRYPEIGAYQSHDSKYYPWYHFVKYPEKYDSWWGIETLPHVNETEPSYLDYIIRAEDSVVEFWLKCGASGFRIDVADELPTQFLELLRVKVKELDPEAALIGEVWEDASNKISYGERRRYLLGKELDSVMNYPLKDAVIRFVAYEKEAAEFAAVVGSLWENYPPQVFSSLMNILGTHDTARILTVLGLKDDLFRMGKDEKAAFRLHREHKRNAKAMLYLAVMIWAFMPGIPCIYYGDEIGMEGAEDPFNRKCFDINGADKDIVSFYRKVLTYRREIADIGQYGFRPEIARNGLYVFTRFKDQMSVITAVNAGGIKEEFSINLGEDGRIIDHMSAGDCDVSDMGRIILGACSGAVIIATE